ETPTGAHPGVVVLTLPADVAETVDRRGAAQPLAAWREHAPAVERRLGLRLIGPVDIGAREQLPVAEWNVDPEVRVARARFEQQHGAAPVSGEAVGEHASRRTRTSHHIVETGQSPEGTSTPGAP